MPTDAPVKTDPTVLSTTPAPEPKPPETVLFDKLAVKDDPAPKPADKPAETPAVPADKPVEPQKPADKPADAKPPTDPTKPVGDQPPKPGETDYVLALPKGSLLTQEDLAKLTKDAKEAGLTKEEAEGMVQTQSDAVQAYADRQKASLSQMRDVWKEACAKDPDIGGEKWPENAALAKRAWDFGADNELKQWAETSGLGNWPPVVRMLVRFGRAMSEDQLVRGTVGPVEKPVEAHEKLYGKTTPGDQGPKA